MLNRIILSDNGTLLDYSEELENFHGDTALMDIISADDKLYIGSRHPFNHLWFRFDTLNTAASNISIKIWDGNSFEAVSEVRDKTKVGAATFAKDGYISWVPDKQKRWTRDDTVVGGTVRIAELTGVTIYESYWAEISFSADLDVTTALSWVGNKFANDDELFSEYPKFAKTKIQTIFQAGKTDWEEQHALAASLLIEDLQERQILVHSGQILERRTFRNAAVSKCAEIIFSALGDDYIDDMLKAQVEYNRRVKKGVYNVDANSDGRLEPREGGILQGNLTRRNN